MKSDQSDDKSQFFPWFDPMGASGRLRLVLWFLLFLLVVALQGPRFITSLPGNLNSGSDFFQDWASAKDWLEGRPIYGPLADSLNRFLDIQADNKNTTMDVHVNAHPPFSLFVVLPFAFLSYVHAMLLWNLVMLGLFVCSIVFVVKTMNLPWHWWGVFPLGTLFLLCGPVQSQIIQGQWNFLLLALLLATYLFDLKNKPWLSGISLGIAAALKLTPIFLILWFVLDRKWKSLFAFILSFVVCNLLAIIVFGLPDAMDYLFRVLPVVREFEGYPGNISWNGFMGKLFFPIHPELLPPLILAPTLGKTFALVLQIAFTSLWVVLFFLPMPEKRERLFLLGIVIMLLVSPITWDHYLVLALPALAFSWRDLRQHPMLNIFFLITLVFFSVCLGDLQLLLKQTKPLDAFYGPIYSVTLLSIPTYALFLLLMMLLHPIFRNPEIPQAPSSQKII